MAVNLSTFLPGWGTGTLAVEVAWGADLTADPDSWTWTDITTDVYLDPGITMKAGRGDEASASQPAELSLRLKNTSSAYSVGGESANWPNVRRGTPVRVRVDPDGSGYVTRFHGQATGWTPAWDATGDVAVVDLAASGTLRRLGQGISPVVSPMTRYAPTESDLIGYWPCEDGNEATAFQAVAGDVSPLVIDGFPKRAANSGFPGSRALPILKSSKWRATVPPYTGTGAIGLSFLAEFPADSDAETDDSDLATIITSGSATVFALYYGTGGTLTMRCYDSSLTLVADSGAFGFDLHDQPTTRVITILLEQDGTDIYWAFSTNNIPDPDLSSFVIAEPSVITSRTLGIVREIRFNNGGLLDDVTVGQVGLFASTGSNLGDRSATYGFVGETPTARIARIAEEMGEAITVTGTSGTTMGVQEIAAGLDVLRSAELADDGVLYDGAGHGLAYVSRARRENRPVDLTVDASSAGVSPDFAPVHDDQRIRNRATVTRTGAGPHTFEDTDGALGTAVVGLYDTSATVNVEDDDQAADYASFLVHKGTQDGYRYPTITLDLRADPTLARGALELGPSSRLDVDGLGPILTGHPHGTLSLLVEGVSHEIAAGTWRATFQCSSYDPWRIGTIGTDAGSPVVYTYSGDSDAADNATITPQLPDLWQTGDLLVMVASIRNSGTGTVNTPDGWTTLVTFGNVSVFGRLATETETVNPQVTFTGGAAGATTLAQVFSVRGTAAHRLDDLADVVHASAAQLNTSAQNVAMPALSVTADGCGILALAWKADDYSSTSNPYSFTDLPVAVSSTAGSDASMFAAFGVQSTATNISSASYSVTGGASAISRGLLIAFLPDPDPPEAMRLDTDGSTLAADVSAGATSISVTTTSGPVWTTDSDDFPYDLEIGGVRFTVTACSDGSSPQTMTVEAAPVARSSGAPVKLWRPPALSR